MTRRAGAGSCACDRVPPRRQTIPYFDPGAEGGGAAGGSMNQEWNHIWAPWGCRWRSETGGSDSEAGRTGRRCCKV